MTRGIARRSCQSGGSVANFSTRLGRWPPQEPDATAIFIMVLALNLVRDALRDLLDPRARAA
jgi:ABC-type dipeptide/oligopeptide/nickel transport system permease subunit